jgi:ureidoglycolate hydrolase
MPLHQCHSINAQPITAEAFAAYGQVIAATPDSKPFDYRDAQLDLSQGTPRFYIMRLPYQGLRFHQITRHQRCTQCLGALAGKSWFIGVAAPTSDHKPNLSTLKAFLIPGTCFVKLHKGTWHAGPYFQGEWADFYNLELADTNQVDHDTYNLLTTHGYELEIVPTVSA